MPNITEEFFDRLAAERQPLLSHTTSTIRLDIEDGKAVEYWHLEINRGVVTVARRKAKAGAVLRLDRGLFERIVAGRANALASMLRGQVSIEGDSTSLPAFQRIFPGPPRKPPPKPIPASEVHGPTSAVAQKPPKAAAKRAVAARKAPPKKATTAKVTAKTAAPVRQTAVKKAPAKKTPANARAKRSAS